MKLPAALLCFMCGMLCLGRPLPSALGQPMVVSEEEHLVTASRAVLSQLTSTPEQAIPKAMLCSANGIAILPNVVKGGFVVGLRHGRGVIMLRDPNGSWAPPQFVTLKGGSVGWQAGIQSTDLILVFRTPNSLRGLLAGQVTIGADVAAAAGPVGRNASIATDTQLNAEIYSYSRSRGLFAGVALDGSSMQIDHVSGARYYGHPPGVASNAALATAVPLPVSALALIQEVSVLTAVPQPAAPPFPSAAQPPVVPNTVDELRPQLVTAAVQLQAIVDTSWQTYLALPVEVTAPGPLTEFAGIERTLGRFDSVAADPRYAAISRRVEFRTMHQLLRQFLAAAHTTVALPPPPR